MVGVSLAMATGLHGRFGWPITAFAAVAAALPDWDSLSILFGAQAYARAHRVWGHNLLVAVLSGSAAGIIENHFGPLGWLCQRAMA